jgi:hypothetical protein
MEGWLIVIVIILAVSFMSWSVSNYNKAKKYEELKPRLHNLESKETDLKNKQIWWEKRVQSDIAAINALAKEKSLGFPWLAEAYSDYFYLQDLKRADYLETKCHPAKKASEHVKEIASERRIAEKLYRILRYQLEYYENLFPWLVDFKGEDIDDLIKQLLDKKKEDYSEQPADPAKKWLTEAEYKDLPSVEKYQLALDRY